MILIPVLLHQNNMALRYNCGAEFLPSPLASKAEFALKAEPPLVRKGHMTAVAVAVEMGHAVAFLGTATGEVKTDFPVSTPNAFFAFIYFLLLSHQVFQVINKFFLMPLNVADYCKDCSEAGCSSGGLSIL